ncbi:alpha/beta hydrolase [Hymenobacter sp. BT683]|uniref:Alpha/beta hydrolase n=1 Tax=Hymenobacter jeongseonensis TaxID=2791027 RepID=A0ABS0IHJ1_9BACT|nr:alpha/beta hydrolase [Hymenobacter jeongseonensis]MBF9237642.1 alpha/beta hydrolase [Hymenobacter jeongseonensis]
MKRSLLLLVCLVSLLQSAALATAPTPTGLRVEVMGKKGGRPLLLVPGYVAPGELWRETAAALASNYQCHVVTLAGTGGTAPLALAPTASYYAAYAQALANYVRANKLKQPVLVAHQTGGMMALRAATDFPELFGGLVLLEALPAPFAVANPGLTLDSLKLPARDKMLPMMVNMPHSTFLEQQKMFIGTWAADTTQQRRILAWAAQADRTTWANIVYESMATDLRPALSQLRVPVLMLGIWVAGKAVQPDLTADKVKPLFERQFAKAGAGAEIRLHNTAREFMMLDDPQWTVANIQQYLTAYPNKR